jgi:acetolactate synthase-1/2/3 large subunit
VIIAGNGVRIAQAGNALRRLAQALGAPVATSAAGKGLLPETDEWALGVYGNFGTGLANAVIGQADVLLVVGSKLGATDTAFENPALIDPQRQRIIQVDVEPMHLSWTFPAEIGLLGDAGTVMDALADRVADAIDAESRDQRAAWLQVNRQEHGHFNAPELTSDETPVLPQRVIRELGETVPDNAVIACDAGENRLFMMHYFQTKGTVTFLQCAGIGAMGYAIPAALAAKLVHPERAAIAVCGDGGFAIGMNGLMSAVEEKIPIVTVVLNNRALGWVKHGQGERSIACDFADFDHAAMARAMGCEGCRVTSPDELAPALRQALDCGKPAVVEVCSSVDETFRKVTSPLVKK